MRLFWILIGILGATLIYLLLSGDRGSFIGISNDAIAQTVFMSIWAILIGAAVLPRQGEFKEFARNIAIWMVLILLLMAGYIFRFELQDFGSRLSGGLIPGSPVSAQNDDGRNTVTLTRGQNGHFEAQAEVNGTSVRFLVDTGASLVILSARDAERAGIDPQSLAYTIPVSTANGMTRAAQVTIADLEIGSIGRENMSAMVAMPGNLDQSLLGMNFVETLWGFEIRGDRLVMTD